MSALKGTRAVNGRAHGKIGLLANGACGRWSVAIDKTISGKDRWFAQLDGPSIYVYFEISSPRIVDDAMAYLDSSHVNAEPVGRIGRLSIGGDKDIPVSLVWDDEFADRVFLVVGPDSAPIVQYTISGADISEIVDALRQVKEDLEN